MRLPFVLRSRVEAEVAQLRDMCADYEASVKGWPEGRSMDMPSYRQGKRDAYRRALSVMERVL